MLLGHRDANEGRKTTGSEHHRSRQPTNPGLGSCPGSAASFVVAHASWRIRAGLPLHPHAVISMVHGWPRA